MNLKREQNTANSSLLILLTILSASIGRCEAQEASDPINLTALIISVVSTLVIMGIALLIYCLCLTCDKWLVARDRHRTRQMAAMLEQDRAQRDASAAEAQPQAAGNTSTISTSSNPTENHTDSNSQPQSSGTTHDPMYSYIIYRGKWNNFTAAMSSYYARN